MIRWLAWLSGANVRIAELEGQNEYLLEVTRDQARGLSRNNETLDRAFQAEDNLRALRKRIAQAALDNYDKSWASELLNVLIDNAAHPEPKPSQDQTL